MTERQRVRERMTAGGEMSARRVNKREELGVTKFGVGRDSICGFRV